MDGELRFHIERYTEALTVRAFHWKRQHAGRA